MYQKLYFRAVIRCICFIAAFLLVNCFNSYSQDSYEINEYSFDNHTAYNSTPEDSIKKVTGKDTSKTKVVGLQTNKSVQNELDTADFKINQMKFFGYPYVFYSPETEFAFGLGGMVYFRTAISPTQKPSKIIVSAYYTSNSQYYITVKPKLYFPGVKRVYIEGEVYFANDLKKFYGIGSSTQDLENTDYNYKSQSFGIYGEIVRKGFLLEDGQFGLTYDYYNMVMKDKMTNPYLTDSSGNVIGNDGGRVGGIGFIWSFDNRDNVSFPSQGGYYKVSGAIYGKGLASDFSFNKFKFDFRQFITPYKDHILACQLYSILTTGSPPFHGMPQVGGASLMRGYYEGRYRDMNYIAGQLEYRKILFWRIGMTAFYSAGEVFDNFGNMTIAQVRSAYGFGLRFVFDQKEKINLRVDFAKTNESTGVYFGVDEAF